MTEEEKEKKGEEEEEKEEGRRPATGRVAGGGGGARWRAGHRGPPAVRPAAVCRRERERECGREGD